MGLAILFGSCLACWHPRVNTILTREFHAIREITGIHLLERDYIRVHGHAGSLRQLAFPRQPLDGYFVEVIPTSKGYTIRALPQEFGVTGRRTFYSDESGDVRESWDAQRPTDGSSSVRRSFQKSSPESR